MDVCRIHFIAHLLEVNPPKDGPQAKVEQVSSVHGQLERAEERYLVIPVVGAARLGSAVEIDVVKETVNEPRGESV